MHNVKIDLSTPTSGRIFLDGVELQGVATINLMASAGGKIHRLIVELMPQTVEVTGLADVIRKHAALVPSDA